MERWKELEREMEKKKKKRKIKHHSNPSKMSY